MKRRLTRTSASSATDDSGGPSDDWTPRLVTDPQVIAVMRAECEAGLAEAQAGKGTDWKTVLRRVFHP